MLHRSLLAPMLATVALAVTTPVQAQNAGDRFVGMFSLRTQLGPGGVGTAFMSLHADGTVTVTSINPTDSAINGVWQKTGPRTVQITEFLFISIPAMGILGIGRIHLELEFTDDFAAYQGKAFNEVVLCQTWQTCPDPLDPNTVWVAAPSQPGALSGIRVSVMPFAPLN